MKQVKGRWLVRWLVVVVAAGWLVTMAEQVTLQPTDRNSTLIAYFCNRWKSMNLQFFLSNLNTTFSSLRRQLTTSRDAEAHSLLNGATVWGHAWCMGYLSVADCLDCFDYAVDQLKSCGIDIGAQAIYSDCGVSFSVKNTLRNIMKRSIENPRVYHIITMFPKGEFCRICCLADSPLTNDSLFFVYKEIVIAPFQAPNMLPSNDFDTKYKLG